MDQIAKAGQIRRLEQALIAVQTLHIAVTGNIAATDNTAATGLRAETNARIPTSTRAVKIVISNGRTVRPDRRVKVRIRVRVPVKVRVAHRAIPKAVRVAITETGNAVRLRVSRVPQDMVIAQVVIVRAAIVRVVSDKVRGKDRGVMTVVRVSTDHTVTDRTAADSLRGMAARVRTDRRGVTRGRWRQAAKRTTRRS